MARVKKTQPSSGDVHVPAPPQKDDKEIDTDEDSFHDGGNGPRIDGKGSRDSGGGGTSPKPAPVLNPHPKKHELSNMGPDVNNLEAEIVKSAIEAGDTESPTGDRWVDIEHFFGPGDNESQTIGHRTNTPEGPEFIDTGDNERPEKAGGVYEGMYKGEDEELDEQEMGERYRIRKGGPGSGPNPESAHKATAEKLKAADKHVDVAGAKYDQQPNPENHASLVSAISDRTAALGEHVDALSGHVGALKARIDEIKTKKDLLERQHAASTARVERLKEMLKEHGVKKSAPDAATADDSDPRIRVGGGDQRPNDLLMAIEAIGYCWSDNTASGKANRALGYPSQGALAVKKVKKVVRKCVPIFKADSPKQIVYGAVLIPDEEDLQGDRITEEEIEKTAHAYLLKSRVVGAQHERQMDAGVVESFIAPMDMDFDHPTYGKQSVAKGSWIIGVKITDPKEWSKVESGDYTGFSVGGLGLRDKIN